MILNAPVQAIQWFLLYATQRLMTMLARYLAQHTNITLKNRLIRHFFSRFPDASLVEAIEQDPFAYESFYALFSRHLKSSVRPISQHPDHLLIPADGVLSHFGALERGELLQAKGCTYSVATLLGNEDEAKTFLNGSYATIYLRPTDYHRVHSPTDVTLKHTRHIPGLLYSVGQKQIHSIPGLLAKNERLVCQFDTPHGPMALVFVGATLVGSVETVWGGITRPKWLQRHPVEKTCEHTVQIQQGKEVGHFHFGSTVVVLTAKTVNFSEMLHPGQCVQFGSTLATFKD